MIKTNIGLHSAELLGNSAANAPESDVQYEDVSLLMSRTQELRNIPKLH